MKKLIIICFLLLYNIGGFAQKVIDEKEFENLVDYVSCIYANKYMEKFKNPNQDQQLKDNTAYSNIIKPVLDNSTLQKHLSSDELIKLLSDNSWRATALKLVQARQNEKKFSEIKMFSEVPSQNNRAIIEYILKIDENFQRVIGNDFIMQIKEELLAEYPDKQVVDNSHTNTNISYQELQHNLNILTIKYEKLTRKFWIFGIIGFILIIGLPTLMYYWLKKQQNKKNNIENQEPPKNKEQSKEFEQENLQDFKEDIIKEIKQEISESSVGKNTKNLIKIEEPEPNTKFFKTKSRKVFYQECDKKEALFKVFNIKSNSAEFEYCGNTTVVTPDFLTDVCKFNNNPWKMGNINRIVTEKAGKVFKNDEGNWEVELKELAEIKFL